MHYFTTGLDTYAGGRHVLDGINRNNAAALFPRLRLAPAPPGRQDPLTMARHAIRRRVVRTLVKTVNPR